MLRTVVVVVVVVGLVLRTTSEHTPLTKPSPFCRRNNHGFICNYFNTTQDLVVGSVSVVASHHPAISCLDVSNDSSGYTTVRKPTAYHHQPRAKIFSRNRTRVNVLPTRTSSNKPRKAPRTLHQDCAVNISVQYSTVQRVQGYFHTSKFLNSKIVNLNGDYMHLDIKNSVVSNISLSSRTIQIEDTKIEFVSQLKAKQWLQLRRADLGTVAHQALQLLPPGREEEDPLHMLSDLAIQRLEAGSLEVVGARVSVNNMTVDWMVKDAIIVGYQGILTLTNVMLHCRDMYYCLKLEVGARLVLRNVTIRNITIIKMDLNATSKGDMYPMFDVAFKKEREPFIMTFSWYWLVIMTVCGFVAGIVIGSAFTWKRPSLNSGPIFNCTLSDLLSHDRLQDNNGETTPRNHTTDHLALPALTRQDSGLTSSSFAYFPFQASAKEGEHVTSSGYNNPISQDV